MSEQPQPILLASRNAKKLAELRRILGASVTVLGLDDVDEFPELPETGATFAENAVVKARQACQETDLISVADDSGLCVDALNGMPGVLSARWSGGHGDDAANNTLLLAQLADVPDERRGAQFVCALALATPDGTDTVEHGRWPGTIAREPRGSNGFGYDPLFLPADTPGTSSAELAPEDKDTRSHRGRAITALLPAIRDALGHGLG